MLVGQLGAQVVLGDAGQLVVAVGAVVLEAEAAPEVVAAQHECIRVPALASVQDAFHDAERSASLDAKMRRGAGVDGGGDAGCGSGHGEGEEFILHPGVISGHIPREAPALTARAELDGPRGLRLAEHVGGEAADGDIAHLGDGRWLEAAADVAEDLDLRTGLVDEANLRAEREVFLVEGGDGRRDGNFPDDFAVRPARLRAGDEGQLVVQPMAVLEIEVEVLRLLVILQRLRTGAARHVQVLRVVHEIRRRAEAEGELVLAPQQLGGAAIANVHPEVVRVLVNDLEDGVIEVLVGREGHELQAAIGQGERGLVGDAVQLEVAVLVAGEVRGVGLARVGFELGLGEVAGQRGVGQDVGVEHPALDGVAQAVAEV